MRQSWLDSARFSDRISLRHCCQIWGLTIAGTLVAIPAHAGPDTRLLFDLGLKSELMGNDLASCVQINGKGQVTGGRTSLSGGGAQAEFGEVGTAWDDLSFAGHGFYGIKLGVPTGNVTTTFLGGSVAMQDDTGRSSISPVYGLRSAWKLDSKLAFNGSLLLAPSASDAQGKLISALSMVYSLRPDTRLAVEMAHSNGGNGWQLSALHTDKKLISKLIYRDAALGFSSAGNPDLIRQRSGYRGEFQAHNGPLSLSGNSQRFRDGRNGRDFDDNLSLGFNAKKLPSLSLYCQNSEQLTLPFYALDIVDGASSAAIADQNEKLRNIPWQPTQSRHLGMSVSDSFKSTHWSLGFDRGQSRVTDTPLSAQSSDRVNFSVSRPVGKRSSIRLLQSWDINSAAQQNAEQSGAVTQVTIDHRFQNGVAISVGLQRQEFQLGQFNGKALLGDLGVQLPLGSRSAVGLQYHGTISNQGPSIGGADRIQIRFSRTFGSGRKRKSSAQTAQQRKLLGQISGHVFEDQNNDGLWEMGEPAIPNVAVTLGRGIQFVTDRQGTFHISDLKPIEYRVNVVNKTLPIEYALLKVTASTAAVTAGKTTAVDFPAVRTGQIKGLVFEDLNRNGHQDNGEKAVAGALVQVQGCDVISFTTEKGEFTLANLPPQHWLVSVDTDLMDGSYQMTASAPVDIAMAPNQIVDGVQLGVASRERDTVNSFSKSN